MSLCAKVPPYLPALDIIPIASVFSIQRLGSHDKAIEASLLFKPIEFDGFKIRIINSFPKT